MTAKKKPNFAVGSGGLVDPLFIPLPVRQQLMLHLVPSPLTQSQKEGLLNFVSWYGQILSRDKTDAGQVQKAQIEAVRTSASRLLANLNLLGKPAIEALQIHSKDLARLSAPAVELDPRIKDAIKQPHASILSSTWDWVAALEVAAGYTSDQYELDRQSKPAQMRGRGFVSMQAQHIHNLTGEWPLADRSGWFAAFAECIGTHLGLPAGPRIVESGIKAAR